MEIQTKFSLKIMTVNISSLITFKLNLDKKVEKQVNKDQERQKLLNYSKY